MTDTPAWAELGETISAIREQLQQARDESQEEGKLRFRTGPVELEFSVEVRKEGDARARIFVLPWSADTLAALAHDADTQPWVRWWAVERLTSIGDGRGRELLAGLAQDTGQHRGIRLNSALALIDADRTRGTEALAALACDVALRGRWRLLAASALAEHDARRAATVVDALADDPTLAPRHRREARRLL